MYTLEVDSDFAAAHRLREYKGQCENLHGHNWRVRLAVAGPRLDATGLLVDFGLLKGWLREELGRLDHEYLNDVPPFDTINPTSENIARHLAERIGARLPAGVRVQYVRVWESDRASAAYHPMSDLRPESADC